MKTLVLAAITVAVAHAVSVYDVLLDEWRLFKTATRRNFRSSDEEYGRLRVFLESKDLVARHNERYSKGLENYHIRLNHFADWLPFEHVRGEKVSTRFMEEISQLRKKSSGHPLEVPEGVSLPDHVDWSAKGAVNNPMDQKTCGSCYAITSAATLEAQIFLKYNTLPRLSPQQILDCSKTFGNDGCGGGTFGRTFEYLMSTGLAEDSAYPYENSAQPTCRVKDKKLSAKVKTYYYMFDGDEEKLKYAVATFGPVAIGLNASPRTFQLYSGGIYSDDTCSAILVHAMLLTGYGTDPKTNKDYWIIRNSWGPSWGEKGFMRLARNSNNMCGIGSLAYSMQIE